MSDSLPAPDLILAAAIRQRDAAEADARLWSAVVDRLIFGARPPLPVVPAPPSNAELVRAPLPVRPPQELARELAAAPYQNKRGGDGQAGRGDLVTIMPGVKVSQTLANRWTPERVLFLRRHVPTDRLWREIWEGFHKLPGDPCPNTAVLTTFCHQKLGLKRLVQKRITDPLMDEVVSPETKVVMLEEFERQAEAEGRLDPDPPRLPSMEGVTQVTSVMEAPIIPAEAPSKVLDVSSAPQDWATRDWSKGRGKNGWLTVDREVRLRQLCTYPGTTPSDIRVGLARLPGPPIPPLIDILTMLDALKLVLVPILRLAEATGPFVPPKPAVTIIAPAPPVPKPKPPPPPPVRPNLGPPRLAKALELPAAMPPATTEPIEADAATIRATVSAWGLGFRGEIDLPAINSAASRRGARPFRLIETTPSKKRKCLRCDRMFETKSKDNWLCVHCAPRGSSIDGV